MTTISTSDSYYLTRYRTRESIADAGFTSPSVSTAQPATAGQSASDSGDSIASISSSSLASALWELDSANAVRTTLSGEAADTSSDDRLLAELQEWSQMTPAEMIRARALEQMGISEDELAAMPADERKAIEDKIADVIKRSLDPDNQKAEQAGDEQRTALSL
ncbi:hypothetical protein [Agrobacterium tumefaciens]|uniref:hypothetical protein n=1 Tax=Agrobacterium tumefaciens TaxID=358 RepID=UPI0021CE90D4|nr:hypothetical protein [Agrobacterium tumefaciens]UXS00536.1 hypothetical protein FY156_03030 [Agrobacterium tumefaciens]